ncbi:MAG: transglycosylase domain protein, partial [Alphaproteobacteria bacterium]|nr:transglycosylase domain protein [Alphaproteobacteria bacterium]
MDKLLKPPFNLANYVKICKGWRIGLRISGSRSTARQKILEIEKRRYVLGSIGFALVLGCAGTAIAVDIPLPQRKPGQEAAAPAPDQFSFITAIRPARKPGQTGAAAPALSNDEVAALAAIRPAAGNPDALRLSPSVFSREPSLIDRMFKTMGSNRLSDEDAARYAHIFAFQDVGSYSHANEEIAKLDDLRLMGHVLYQRYTSADYRATYKELADWMKRFADHPGAQRIYDLAQKKKTKKDTERLVSPRSSRGVYAMHDFDVGQLAQPYIRSRSHAPAQRDLIKSVSENIGEAPTSALGRLEKKKELLPSTDYDALQGDVAASYFYNGKIERAYELASASAKRSGKDVPLAGWIGGLSAWQLGKYPEAAKLFEMTARSDRTSAWMSAAGAYWTARSYLRARQPQNVNFWLKRAAEFPRTFYGLIAMKALGMEQAKFNWKTPELSDKHVKAMMQLPAGRRAMALVKSERPDLAEQELRQMNPGDNTVLQEAMIAVANDNGMPALAMRMGSAFRGKNGKLYDSALYPDVPWKPAKGFTVDRALVYAFIRQESKFDYAASNKSSGAVGLMQLMPMTAKHVARKHGDDIAGEKLQDPVLNIDLGQKYLKELLNTEYVDNNLFKLAVA